MEQMEKIKNMLEKELKGFAEKQHLNAGDLDVLQKLTDTVKNICKIKMLDEEDGSSEGLRDYYDEDSSYARGRRRAKRDSMGRYSREGYSERYYSDGDSYDDSYGSSRGYSRRGAKDQMMKKLGEMMEEADPEARKALQECMRTIERA